MLELLSGYLLELIYDLGFEPPARLRRWHVAQILRNVKGRN